MFLVFPTQPLRSKWKARVWLLCCVFYRMELRCWWSRGALLLVYANSKETLNIVPGCSNIPLCAIDFSLLDSTFSQGDLIDDLLIIVYYCRDGLLWQRYIFGAIELQARLQVNWSLENVLLTKQFSRCRNNSDDKLIFTSNG